MLFYDLFRRLEEIEHLLEPPQRDDGCRRVDSRAVHLPVKWEDRQKRGHKFICSKIASTDAFVPLGGGVTERVGELADALLRLVPPS